VRISPERDAMRWNPTSLFTGSSTLATSSLLKRRGFLKVVAVTQGYEVVLVVQIGQRKLVEFIRRCDLVVNLQIEPRVACGSGSLAVSPAFLTGVLVTRKNTFAKSFGIEPLPGITTV